MDEDDEGFRRVTASTHSSAQHTGGRPAGCWRVHWSCCSRQHVTGGVWGDGAAAVETGDGNTPAPHAHPL